MHGKFTFAITLLAFSMRISDILCVESSDEKRGEELESDKKAAVSFIDAHNHVSRVTHDGVNSGGDSRIHRETQDPDVKYHHDYNDHHEHNQHCDCNSQGTWHPVFKSSAISPTTAGPSLTTENYLHHHGPHTLVHHHHYDEIIGNGIENSHGHPSSVLNAPTNWHPQLAFGPSPSLQHRQAKKQNHLIHLHLIPHIYVPIVHPISYPLQNDHRHQPTPNHGFNSFNNGGNNNGYQVVDSSIEQSNVDDEYAPPYNGNRQTEDEHADDSRYNYFANLGDERDENGREKSRDESYGEEGEDHGDGNTSSGGEYEDHGHEEDHGEIIEESKDVSKSLPFVQNSHQYQVSESGKFEEKDRVSSTPESKMASSLQRDRSKYARRYTGNNLKRLRFMHPPMLGQKETWFVNVSPKPGRFFPFQKMFTKPNKALRTFYDFKRPHRIPFNREANRRSYPSVRIKQPRRKTFKTEIIHIIK